MSNQQRVSIIVVPSTEVRHVRGKQSGKDWYVQRAGLEGGDGLSEPFEIWHAKQEQALKPGRYTIENDGAYVSDKRLSVRPRFVPVSAAKAA